MALCTVAGAGYWIAALTVALILDTVYPRHTGILYLVHPVRIAFFTAKRLAKPYTSVARGVLVWVIVTVLVTAPAAALLCLSQANSIVWVLAAAVILKFSVSLRLLLDTVLDVARLLGSGDLDKARARVGEIVRRPTHSLPEPLVASAAIESLAESLVDGYTSPLTYYPLLGPLGPLLQRVANTLDGAIGYKTPEYERVGKASAYADTIINYVPARVTAILIALASPLAGGSLAGALRVWARWRGATESINAGHPMAAIAGALGVRLEKPGHYIINADARDPTPGDIVRAVRIVAVAATLYTLMVVALVLVSTR